jgi:hypothetical protein
MTTQTDISLRNWLLGRLDATDADGVDESLFVNTEQADRIDEVRRDLIDAAAAGRLDRADSDAVIRLARHSASARERWLVAQALARYRVTHRARMRRSWAVWSAALAACLVLALAVTRPWQAADNAPTIALRAVAQRGVVTANVPLPPNDGQVRLQADIGDAAADHFTLRIADGEKTLFEQNDLTVRHAGQIRFVEATVPTAAMGPGGRHITVAADGTKAISTWDVTVTRQ